MAGQESSADPAAAALNELADAADDTAREQHEVAVASRRLSHERDRGASWREIADGGTLQRLLGHIGASARRLSAVGNGLRRALAVVLSAEGLTTRQIGERFGVSHQRVSSLLRQQNNSGAPNVRGESASDSSADPGAQTGSPPGVER
jgi:hypothetical protein